LLIRTRRSGIFIRIRVWEAGLCAFIEEAVSKGEHVGVSAITIVGIVYLMEKGRIPIEVLRRF